MRIGQCRNQRQRQERECGVIGSDDEGLEWTMMTLTGLRTRVTRHY